MKRWHFDLLVLTLIISLYIHFVNFVYYLVDNDYVSKYHLFDFQVVSTSNS